MAISHDAIAPASHSSQVEWTIPQTRLTPLSGRIESTAEGSFDASTEAVRYGEKGRLLLASGQFAEALERFEQSLALCPHEVDTWCDRAEALACLDRHQEALDSLEQAQALASVTSTRLWMQKAVLLILLSRYEDALCCCNCVLRRAPDHVQAFLFQGVALQRLGQYRQAYRSYRQVSALTQPPFATKFRRSIRELKPHPTIS